MDMDKDLARAAVHAAPDDHLLDDGRRDQLMRWHVGDAADRPPANTRRNRARATVAAIGELRVARARIAELRAAMGQAFWATDYRTLHEILLTALGPPPEDDKE